ncbi:non-ribosomal peptide synthetase [Aquimarina pacifica]|uniref:non-ribosomal peptide synthetase n=1 Tax=Aquimarina pacifica TaxID=1296415 RepID=UPI00046FF3DE|nr:non-ribosomal peptide synthetase [Aquimarina pacifica]
MTSNILEDTSLQEFSYNQKKVVKDGANTFYSQVILEFTSKVNKDHLLKALSLLISRYEALSQAFVENESLNKQKAPADHSVTYYEVDDKNEENIITQLDRSYDFRKDAPIRFGFITSNEEVTRLYIRLYILCGDVFSNRLFISELGKAINNLESYSKEQQQKVTYSKYCEWYNALIEESDSDATNFWESYNHQPSQGGVLPFLKKRKGSFVPKRIRINTISGPHLKGIRKYCQENNVGLSEYLFTQFLEYLQKFTDNDVTVGYYPQERNYEELNQTLGLINKVIPIKTAVPIKGTQIERIKKIKEQIEEVTLWSDYYLPDANDSEEASTFSTSFEFIDFSSNHDKDIVINDFFVVQDIFDLKLSCTDFQDQITLELYYNSETIDFETIKIIESQLELVHGSLKSNTTLSVFEKSIIDVSNNTSRRFDSYSCMGGFFETQLIKYQDNTALIQGNDFLSYKDLNERSSQFAHHLINKFGIRKGDAVCLCMEPSINFVVSLFGVLKAGGYYVPLDHNYPEERINYILRDSNSKVIISDSDTFDIDISNILVLDPNDPLIFQNSKESPKVGLEPSDLVYSIYTSGSTGNPKGCLVTHKNLLNYIQWANEYYFENDKKGNWGLITSISFDLTVTSIFTSLTRGNKLWIGDANKSSDELLKESFLNSEIDTLKLTPSHLSLLKEMNIQNTSVRTIICGGEQLKRNQIKILKDIHPEIRVFNEYGPTEATVGCVVTEVNDTDTPILIGKPIANTKIHIIDNQNEECGIGVVGELVISGDGLSIGYHNRLNLTEKKFKENFLNFGYKGYLTGDLGRWLPNGKIEYLGRKDNQVKIRGYRIELEDIESKLMSYDLISNAVVLVGEKEEELVAYLVGNANLIESELRDYLVKKIPEYMIPTDFVLVEKIPLTINGKVDKTKLINTTVKNIDSGITYKEPTTEIEKQIAKLWQEILGKEKIGLLDDFFALGGHSLKAIRLINEYYKKLNIKLTLKQLFDHKTLQSHAELLSSSLKSKYEEIIRVPEKENYVVSDGQRRIWMLSQFEESSIAYNMPASINLEGVYDPDILSKAIKACIERHEILRTIYDLDESGELRQKVVPVDQYDFKLEFFDYRNHEDKRNVIRQDIEHDSQKKFNLSQGPLLRAKLYQIEDEEFLFYYNLHHITGDSWSFDILEKEVFKFYTAFEKEEKVDIPQLKLQYKDYANWQLKQLESDSLKAQKEYWIKSLGGKRPKIDLTNCKQRPKIKTYTGRTLMTYLSPELIGELKGFCNENGGSLFMGLLSLWNVLLSKYTSSNDLIIGTPVSCRNHKDLENQIGFYLNTLALRNTIDASLSFETIYEQIKASTLQAYKNQSYPFDRLVDDLQLPQDLSRNPVFDVMFTLQRMENNSKNIEVAPSQIHKIVDTGFSLSKFDIDISFFEFDNTMALGINYNTDIYERFFVENLMSNFIHLSKNVLSKPKEKIQSLSYISDKEVGTLLNEFNATDINKEPAQTILELFKSQVMINENKVALNFDDKTYSYQEIDEISNQLAQFLKTKHKVKPESIVGIKLDRTEWLVISILAVLKVDAAYVPISPALPKERMEYIKNDSQYSYCISTEDIDDFKKEADQFTKEYDIINSIDSSNVCYVIYTSGTTGNPKGVTVSHENLISFMSNINTRFGLKDCNKIGVTTNFTFDISILEILGGLCSGKELILFSDSILLDPEKIIDHIDKHQVEAIQLTPSRLAQLYETNIALPNSLKVALIGGEAMNQSIYNKLQNEKFESINVYGPTETTIWSTSLSIKESTSLSIGKPLNNERIYIVNKQNELQPVGVVGELCIGGDGVSLGYINKKQLTNEKFILNPWVPNQRIYKTGDMAMWREDGTIEFFGRIDDQVKIRGYRIELGEIENTLLKNEKIKGATVLVRKNNNEEKDIVAYLISDETLNVSLIRSHLGTILPAYMIPSIFIQVDNFPLTSSGKVDRNKLKAYDGEPISSGEKYQAPRNEQEEKLVNVLATHLDRDPSKISIYDNFFDLGINSLKMIKMLGQINNELDSDLKIVTLFEYPNIDELSQYFMSMDNEDELQEEPSNISEDLDEILDLL